MKILKILRKKWLTHRVYKYTLEYSNALSKSEYYNELSKRYFKAALIRTRKLGDDDLYVLSNHKKSLEYQAQSNHFKILADMYLSKKNDLEKELNS